MIKYKHIEHTFGIVDNIKISLLISETNIVDNYDSFIKNNLKNFYKKNVL